MNVWQNRTEGKLRELTVDWEEGRIKGHSDEDVG